MLIVAGLAACDKPGPRRLQVKDRPDSRQSWPENRDAADSVGEKMSAQSAKAVWPSKYRDYAKVKAAIFAEPGLKTLQISVDTVKGV